MKTARLLFVLLGIGAAGCATGTSNLAAPPQKLRGEIDLSAPADVQVRQDAFSRLMRAIQEAGLKDVRRMEGDLVFDESSDSFFAGTAALSHWDWDGPPQGDEFPVVLHLVKDEPGLPIETHHRTYRITITQKKRQSFFVIERVTEKV